MIDPELLEECGGHQDDRVRVQSTTVWFVKVVLSQQLLDDQHYVSQVSIVLLQLLDLMHRRDGQRAALSCQ